MNDANAPLLPAGRVAERPPSAPRTNSPFGRWLGRKVLRLGGWRMVGEWPDVPKLMIIAAPHSSGWDAFWYLAAKVGMGLRIDILAKRELFWWPLGAILRTLGAIPIDRSAAKGAVPGAIARLRDTERAWMVIAPEGTRKRVEKWKSGFWHIARGADVPVVCAYFHYPERTIGLSPPMQMTADLAADMARVREFYRPWQGKHRGTV